MLHMGRVGIDEAMEATKDVRTSWLRAKQHPGAPAFSGGVLDCWPQRMVDGFAICSAEMRLVDAYRLSQRKTNG